MNTDNNKAAMARLRPERTSGRALICCSANRDSPAAATANARQSRLTTATAESSARRNARMAVQLIERYWGSDWSDVADDMREALRRDHAGEGRLFTPKLVAIRLPDRDSSSIGLFA